MNAHRTIAWIAAASLALVLLAGCGEAPAPAEPTPPEEPTPAAEPAPADVPYNGLFDQSVVHTLDVEISDADLQDQRANPLDKTKYHVAVTIDGERLEDVSFSTKGSSSLTMPVNSGSCRYPFKLNFGKFDKEQTYYGLDKLNLSNFYGDASEMKDWLAYRIMAEAGVDAPLTSYVWLTINGEDMGLYLAIEEIGDGWMDRTGHRTGALYKPEARFSNMNNDGAADAHIISEEGLLAYFLTRMERFGSPEESGSALVYIDDEYESYPDIFDNAETKVTDEDKARLIRSIRALNDPAQRRSVIDTEEVIRYFAAHNFVLSPDSYTGLTAHNYYLYEQDGILSMYPWDYNSSFGRHLSSLHPELSRDAIVGWDIDAPLFDTVPSDRPMWAWIAEEEDSLAQYHAVMDELVANYFESGRFEAEIDAIYALIEPYQAKDPTAFFSPEESRAACQDLKAFCTDRASAVRAQLDTAG